MTDLTQDPRLFKKYNYLECTDFTAFYTSWHHQFRNEGHARAVWNWARSDVQKRAKRYGLDNPLEGVALDVHSVSNLHAPLQAVTTGPKPLPSLEERERLYDSLEAASMSSGILSPTVEQTTLLVPQDAPVMIWFVGDIHSGGKIRYDLLKRDMQLLANTDGAYAIGMGDYTDNFKPQAGSGNGVYTAAFPDPRLQLAHVTDRMGMADGKWIALCQGNHDAWDYKYAGIDRLPDLANTLGAAYFSEAGGTVFVDFGGERYVIVVKHQYSGGSKINTSASQRRLFEEYPQWENADVVCLGHLHYNDLHQTPRKGRTVTYLRNGTYKTDDDWAAMHGFNPEYGVPSVILYPHEHVIVPFRGDRIIEAVQFFTFVRATYGR